MTIKPYLFHLSQSGLREKILVYFFTHANASHYLRETAELLQVDPANLSREFRNLEKEGVFQSEERGNQKYFSLNPQYALYGELKSMVEKKFQPESSLQSPGLRREDKTTKAAVYVVAGPNGAGKTTFAKKFLPQYVHCPQFVNADLIAGGLSPFAPETSALTAGKILLEQMDTLSRKGMDFGFETTLAGKSYVRLFERLRGEGYKIHLFFLWIPDISLALARIKERVKRGGHSIPEPVVKRRFHRGLEHFFHLYRPLLDSWILFDSSDVEPHLIAYQDRNEEASILDAALYEQITKKAGAK